MIAVQGATGSGFMYVPKRLAALPPLTGRVGISVTRQHEFRTTIDCDRYGPAPRCKATCSPCGSVSISEPGIRPL